MALAGMVFVLLLALLVGGFFLLHPLSKQLGVLLEEKVREKKRVDRTPAPAATELRDALQALESEVRVIAERQQFIEQLLAKRAPDALPAGRPEDR